MLLKLEDEGSGRVRLSKFHKDALGGKWMFQESVDYLRKLGALDETIPGNARVIIPNYITGLSNCLGDPLHFSMCCISECEELMAHLERALGKPEALPAEVAALVAALPS